jgi:hypothetical protein
MGKINVCFGLLFACAMAGAQAQDSCRVLLKDIAGIYKGDCKDGLAYGKGSSQGTDSYKGMFKDGLPDGKGEYTYKNGDRFIGYWQNGLKNGEGKYLQSINGKVNTIKGYWVNGEYAGLTKPSEPYRVNSNLGIDSYTIQRIDDSVNQIEISITGAAVNYVPRDLTIETTSGQLQQESKRFSIYNFQAPNRCTINFTIRSGNMEKRCSLVFEVLRTGKYSVQIVNN